MFTIIQYVVFSLLQIGNLEKNVQNLKVQLAGAHGNHKEAMDQVIDVIVVVVVLLLVVIEETCD